MTRTKIYKYWIFILVIFFATQKGIGQIISGLDRGNGLLVQVVAPSKIVAFPIEVKVGCTLSSLASSISRDSKTILTYNKGLIKADKCINSKILIPLKTDEIISKPLVSKRKEVEPYFPVYYYVSKGETLFHISKKLFGKDIKMIQSLNNLPDGNIKLGQKLLIGYVHLNVNSPSIIKNDIKHGTLSKDDQMNIATKVGKTSYILGSKPSTSLPPKPKSDKVEFSVEDIKIADLPKKENIIVSSSGIAMWDKESSESKNYYVLHNDAKIGSMVEVTFPMLNRKAKAKVLGRIPDGTYDDDVSIFISPAVARELGMLDNRGRVIIKHAE